MKHLIFTACDKNYEDFLYNQWWRSLKTTNDLGNVDVLVLDYGLTEPIKRKLAQDGVIVETQAREGAIVNLRFCALADFLSRSSYDQVLATDGGDIIFQTDITCQFQQNKQAFRAVYEDLNIGFENLFIHGAFSPELTADIQVKLKGKRMANAGVLFGPASGFIDVGEKIRTLMKNKEKFGPDQILLNYYLLDKPFVELPAVYNFIFHTAAQEFTIKNGYFYDGQGDLIPIVHNAGRFDAIRAIDKFGYGPGHNQKKTLFMHAARPVIWLMDRAKRLKDRLSTSDRGTE